VKSRHSRERSLALALLNAEADALVDDGQLLRERLFAWSYFFASPDSRKQLDKQAAIDRRARREARREAGKNGIPTNRAMRRALGERPYGSAGGDMTPSVKSGGA
jgi:hypothetical protein